MRSLTHRVRFAYNDLMSFYTSKGDDGTTNLLGEGRVAKYHARIEAVGTLSDILIRMQRHQTKKRAMLRELHLADQFRPVSAKAASRTK